MAIADIVGTFVIAGMLVIMMIGLTASVTETTSHQTLDVTTQQALVTVARTVEYDFLKMGYLSLPGTAIVAMGPHNIEFWAGIDTDGDGEYDSQNTITYQLSDTSQAASTPNPDDRVLFRTVGGHQPTAVALGVTDFDLRYFDASGNETTNPSEVKTISVSLVVQSTVPYGDRYSVAVWERRIRPKNL